MRDAPAKTPVLEHADRAIEMMKQGARLHLSDIPTDPSMLSSLFSGEVSQEIARRLGVRVSDYLMPGNEDFRQGYSVGYSHAYGDVSDLKAGLMAMKEALEQIGKEAQKATSRDYAVAVSVCQKIADLARKAGA